MSKDCFFRLKVTGKREDAEEFCRNLKRHTWAETLGVSKIISIYEKEQHDIPESVYAEHVLEGTCESSIDSSMFEQMYNGSRILHLCMEVYGEQPESKLQEYYLIVNGNCLVALDNDVVIKNIYDALYQQMYFERKPRFTDEAKFYKSFCEQLKKMSEAEVVELYNREFNTAYEYGKNCKVVDDCIVACDLDNWEFMPEDNAIKFLMRSFED